MKMLQSPHLQRKTVALLFRPLAQALWVGSLALGFAGLPKTASGTDYPGALVVTEASPTKVMIGYAIWFGPDGYTWAPQSWGSHWDATLAATYKNYQEADILAGLNPRYPFINFNDFHAHRLDAIPRDFPNGYVSDDPAVINHHAAQLADLGADIIVPDLTNSISGAFSNAEHPNGDGCTPRSMVALFATLNGNLTTNLHIAPATGAQTSNGGTPSPDLAKKNPDGSNIRSDGLSPFQGSLLFLKNLLQQYPKMAVLYSDNPSATNKPLVIVYHGVIDVDTLIAATDAQHAELGSPFTLRHMTGYIESQPGLWHNPARDASWPTNPYTRARDGLWTWCDRLYTPGADGFNSYAMRPGSSRTEFVSINPTSPPFPDTDPFLTFSGGAVLNQQLTLAKQTNPIFLFHGHWNFFMGHDSGYTLETQRDAEPTTAWGSANFDVVKAGIARYRTPPDVRFSDVSVRGMIGTDANSFILGFSIASGAPQRVTVKAVGQSLVSLPNCGFVSSMLAVDPSIDLYQGASLIGTNDNWQVDCAPPSPLPLNGNRLFHNSNYYISSLNFGQAMNPYESAITARIDPGNYTVVMRDNGATGRIIHTRVVFQDEISTSRATSLSARARVESDARVLIFGFVLNQQMEIGIRGSGPSLAAFGVPGVLADPELVLYNAAGEEIERSSDISSNPTLWNLMNARYGGWTLNPLESAIKRTLQPGAYTVHLRNQNPGSSADGVGHLDIQMW